MHTLLADTLLDLAALEQWHAAAQSLADPYSLTETRFVEGYAETFAENAENYAEMATYADFHAMKLMLRGNGNSVDAHTDAPLQPDGHINWYALTPAQIAQLQVIAERNTGRTSVMAKGVLCFFHGICYEDDLVGLPQCDSPTLGDDTSGVHTKRAATNIADDDALTVWPNPAADLLHIALRGAGIAEAVLYDLQGRVVETGRAPSLQGTATLNVRNVPAGEYV